MGTKFYNFSQNNSGGYFVYDDEVGLCEEVIIEASDSKAAWNKMVEIIDSSSQHAWSSCSCCGERWSNWMDDEDGKDEPCIYGNPISETTKGMFKNNVIVHYINGTFKKYELLDKV